MDYTQKIKDYLEENGGHITASYCRDNDIPTVYLTRLVRENKLIRESPGLYRTEYADYDEFLFFQMRYKKVIYSYETALFLQHLGEKIPYVWDITVPKNYKFNKKPDRVRIHYVDEEIHELGVTKAQTMYGNDVRVYSYERLLCDFIANRDQMDPEVFVKMVNGYRYYEDRDMNLLYKISKEMGIAKEVRDTMVLVYE